MSDGVGGQVPAGAERMFVEVGGMEISGDDSDIIPVPAGGDGLREALAWLDLADDMLDRYGDKLTPIRVRAVHGYVQHARAALAALQKPAYVDECHEDMGTGPCGRPAVDVREDPNHGGLYPVCDEHLDGLSSGAPEEGLTEAWQDGFNAGVESVLGEEGLTCGDHPDRKAIAQRGYCAECYRKFMEQGEGQLTAEEWEGERCQECGEPYDYVWWCHDPSLWEAVTGHAKLPGDNAPGLLCIPCFDRLAKGLCCWIEWSPLNLRHLERHPRCTLASSRDAPE